MHFVRGRRNTFSNTGSTLAEPSRKGRRLVKKNVARENLETVLSDSDQEWNPVRLYKNNNSKSIAKRTERKRKLNIFEAEGTSDVAVINSRGSTVESLDGIEEGTHWNHLAVSEDSNSCPEGARTASEIADGPGSTAENLNAKNLVQVEVCCHVVIDFVIHASKNGLITWFLGEEFQPVLCARLDFQS
ncbi:hypothetical protein OIU84_014689 [Salix udensis]|uniref:Uncharacterized protein n=1 Tax=Salix udensis TaxID=889485 RepID=A0AAD6JEA8_9ROSI|nr:hypothetical protein OIU84_014689 [Salix udensis]